MKRIIALMIVLVSVSSAWAQSLVVTDTTVTDNFNRTAGYGAAGSMGGTTVWTNGYPSSSQWGIVDNQASANLGSGSVGLLVNKALPTLIENGTNFTLSAEVNALTDGKWTGIMFNYTDENNYYYFRFKSGTADWVLAAFKGGVLNKLGATGTASSTLSSNTFYTLTVTSTDLYSFDVTIAETSSGTVLVSDSRVGVDPGEQLPGGGYGGLYQATLGIDLVRFDNFSLERILPPLVVTDTLVTDNFNRGNVGYGSAGSMGADVWTNIGPNSQWGIIDDEATANIGSVGVGQLVNTALGTANENGLGFTLSADVKAFANDRWAGVMFNCTDTNNYYYFRFKSGTGTWVVNAVQDGVLDRLGLGGEMPSGTFSSNTYYTLTVTSTNLYNFDVSIKETSSGTVLVSDSRVGVDATEQLSGGYGGLYQATRGYDLVRFDNFSLEHFSTMPASPDPAHVLISYDSSNNLVIASSDLSSAAASNVLQMATTLVPADWEDVGFVSGVQSNEWTIPMTNSSGFFRVLSY